MSDGSGINKDNETKSAEVDGSGAVAYDSAVAAGERGIAVGGDIQGDVRIGGTTYTRSQVEEFRDYLGRAVADYERRLYRRVSSSTAPPEQPYKSLYAFDIEDASIFFGRDAARDALFQAMLRDRLAVLHAKSGAGKTSLLLGGLTPLLTREGRLPIYARAYDDPIGAIKQALAPPSLGPWPKLMGELTLQEFLGGVRDHLSREVREVVIIIDQFEEFFVFLPDRNLRRPFINALADCYYDSRLPLRFVISIRNDYFSHLATFQDRLHQIFYNEYFLETMSREEAKTAIAGPAAKSSRSVTYEPALLDALLEDLARGGMELPHLQIVCSRLFETLPPDKTIITLDAYEVLGRAEGLLGGYLNTVLQKLPGKGPDVARAVLKELISSQGAKRVLSYDLLKARIKADEDELASVLDRLVTARILQRAEELGEITYEMAHQYLVDEISGWVDQTDLEFKQVEELLKRAIANWRVHHTPVQRDRLGLLYTHRERFGGMDLETLEVLLHSALQARFLVLEWAELAGSTGLQILVEALKTEDSVIRQEAVTTLGQLGDPSAEEPLIAALQDEEFGVRWAAAQALENIGTRRSLAALGDERIGKFPHGYALLVGVGEHSHAQWSLPATEVDIEMLRYLLKGDLLTGPTIRAYLDENVCSLTGPQATRDIILDRLAWLKGQAATDPDATIIFYYSGHGWLQTETGHFFLIPFDAEPHDIPGTALSAQALTEALREIPAQRLLVFIDTDHAGTMTTRPSYVVSESSDVVSSGRNAEPSGMERGALPKEVMAELTVGRGRAVFASSREDQYSYIAADRRMSLFTYHLIEAMQGAGNQPGDTVVRVSNLMNHLAKAVPKSARKLGTRDQTPVFQMAGEDFPVALLREGDPSK